MEHAGMKKQTERALKKLAGNGYPDVREALDEISDLRERVAFMTGDAQDMRGLLARCEPHVHGNVAEWRKFLGPQYSGSAHQAATWRIADGEELLREIAEALGDD
jgi:hypothetical protein